MCGVQAAHQAHKAGLRLAAVIGSPPGGDYATWSAALEKSDKAYLRGLKAVKAGAFHSPAALAMLKAVQEMLQCPAGCLLLTWADEVRKLADRTDPALGGEEITAAQRAALCDLRQGLLYCRKRGWVHMPSKGQTYHEHKTIGDLVELQLAVHTHIMRPDYKLVLKITPALEITPLGLQLLTTLGL